MKKILLSLILGFSNFATANECQLSSEPVIISQETHELHQFWTLEDDSIFTSNKMPDSPALIHYLNEIKSKISDTNPRLLLLKQYNDFMLSGSSELVAEAANMSLAANMIAGKFHSINCLEALLLSQQIDRGLSWDTPMEFSAFILKSKIGEKSYLKIYYSTNDRPGGKISSQVMGLIQDDLLKGWILLNHLHNHNFNMPVSNGVVLVGGPSPGLSDVSLYRDLLNSIGLNSASVTNGFDTLNIDSSEFSIFHAH